MNAAKQRYEAAEIRWPVRHLQGDGGAWRLVPILCGESQTAVRTSTRGGHVLLVRKASVFDCPRPAIYGQCQHWEYSWKGRESSDPSLR